MNSVPHSGLILHCLLILDRDWSMRDMRKTHWHLLESSLARYLVIIKELSRPNYLLSISVFLSKPSGYHTLISLQFKHLPTPNFHKFPFTSSVCLPMKGELRFARAQTSFIYNSDNSELMLKQASLNLVFPQ